MLNKILPFRSTGKLNEDGMTITELVLVIGMFAVLSSVAMINLVRPQVQSSVDSVAYTLAADMKQQQIKAMVGDSGGTGTAQQYGIYFESDGYTLFRGASYTPGAASNFKVDLDSSMEIASINFPSSTLVFSRRSGEVDSYSGGSDNVTIRHTSTGGEKVVTLNRYGVVSIN
jgi:type II secretory pathway pseudopilin PulG